MRILGILSAFILVVAFVLVSCTTFTCKDDKGNVVKCQKQTKDFEPKRDSLE